MADAAGFPEIGDRVRVYEPDGQRHFTGEVRAVETGYVRVRREDDAEIERVPDFRCTVIPPPRPWGAVEWACEDCGEAGSDVGVPDTCPKCGSESMAQRA